MITFKEYIEEAKQVGTIYHFTTLPSLYHMIHQVEPFKMESSNGETISATRHPALHINKHFSDCRVRISLDGDKLSENHKIRPVAGFSYNQSGVTDVNSPHPRISRHSGEAEEAILTYPLNIRKYIKHIHILPSKHDSLYPEVHEKLTKLNISHKYGRALSDGNFEEEYDLSEHFTQLKLTRYGK